MVVLLNYLTRHGFEPITLTNENLNGPIYNTRSDSYRYHDIPRTVPMKSLSDLRLTASPQVRAALQQDLDIADWVPLSRPRPIRNERAFQSEVIHRLIIPYTRRAIEAGNPELTVCDGDEWPGQGQQGKPDVSFVQWGGRGCDGDEYRMRFPLEVKVSQSWKPGWRMSTDIKERREYRQVLSQIHYYMDQWERRYGGVLTDQGLVIVERMQPPTGTDYEAYGKICVYDAIPWEVHGHFVIDELHDQSTLPLALWCMTTRSDHYMPGHDSGVSAVHSTDQSDDEDFVMED
jgi:hypothetical protein